MDDVDRNRQGLLLCALSAAGFGAMAVFAKLAYDEGAGVLEMLAIRFLLAAAVLNLIARPSYRTRAARQGFALGAGVYAVEAFLFFAAVKQTGAAPAELLLCAYPAFVVLGAVLLGKEAASRRRVTSLALATGGVVLVMAGARTGAIDPLGALLALFAATAYAAYVLFADSIDLPAGQLAAVVCAGAATSITLVSGLGGQFHLAFGAAGWGWIGAIAVLCTVVPLTAFLGGVARVGPSRAAILSMLEPPVTVLLAFLAFSETLTPLQLAGGALVVGAVALASGASWRPRSRRPSSRSSRAHERRYRRATAGLTSRSGTASEPSRTSVARIHSSSRATAGR